MSRTDIKATLAIALLMLWPKVVHAQDISQIAKSDPLIITGAVGTQNTYYHSSMGNGFASPLTNSVWANLNISVYGFSMPFSFYYANSNTSFNYPHLVEAGVNITYHRDLILKPDWKKPMTPHFRLDNNVIIFSLFPGIREDLIRHIIHTPNLKAIVMRTFGSGNAPQKTWLLNALKEGTRNGKVIVNISQCMQGAVEMSRYDCGYHLQEAGVISGKDSTVESAVTKLMFLQSHYPDDPETVRHYMQRSIRGEITI